MANTFKQVIPTANRKKTLKSYSFDHMTTSTFMIPQPIAVREVIPNMELKMSCESFTRLNPLVKPTFGRARVNNRAFFVPMRVLMPQFNKFLASEPYYSVVDGGFGLSTSTPVISNYNILALLQTLSSSASAADFDWSYLDSNNVVQYAKFTQTGRIAYTILLSLGYKINFNEADTETYSALPLMAYTKIMIDWYYPSQYINSSDIQTITPYFENDSLSAVSIPFNVIGTMITVCKYSSYDDSLPVDAWDRPVAPNNGVESQYSLPDLTLPSGLPFGSNDVVRSSNVNNNNSNGTPASEIKGNGTTTYQSSITQYQHDMLKALTDYTTRHRLSGVRAVDRLLAEYGINLSSEIMKRSVMLGSDTFNIQFGDVMAHSDTYDVNTNTGAALGDYAGKGIGYGNHVFSYNLGNEFGYFIIVSSVIPEVGYYQGMNRFVKHKSILDFWHADFDGLGVQAMAVDEVYNPEQYVSVNSLPSLHSSVFGFVPRYAEYKSAPSILSGLFALNGNADIKKFSFMRDLYDLFGTVSPSNIKHSVNFVRGLDSEQYNRAFYNQNIKDGAENFIFIHHFNVEQVDETAPLYDTYDFKQVERAVEVHTQAAKVN